VCAAACSIHQRQHLFGRFSLFSFFHSFIRYILGSALSGRGPNERLCFRSHPSPSSFFSAGPPAAGGPLNAGPCVTRIDCFHMRVRELPDQHKEKKHPTLLELFANDQHIPPDRRTNLLSALIAVHLIDGCFNCSATDRGASSRTLYSLSVVKCTNTASSLAIVTGTRNSLEASSGACLPPPFISCPFLRFSFRFFSINGRHIVRFR
jgi:hypothetical protein